MNICLIQKSLLLEEGDIICQIGFANSYVVCKLNKEWINTIYNHSDGKQLLYLGNEFIPDLFHHKNFNICEASKCFLLGENKIVFQCWTNKDNHPRKNFKVLTER